MKNKFLLLLANVFLTSCSLLPNSSFDKSSISSNVLSSSNQTIDENIFSNPALTNSEEYLLFWSNSSLINISLSFSNESIKALEDNGRNDFTTQDYYFPCDVTFTVNNKTYFYNEVGARRKGNLSKSDDFNKGKIHYKLSFKETFDDDFYKTTYPSFYHDWSDDTSGRASRKDRTFLDMEKLDLKWNRNEDETSLRQSYTNYIFKKAGLICPNNNIARVDIKINNEISVNQEIYDVIEAIDKIKIKRYFNKNAAKGDLYKLTYNSVGKADFNINNVLNGNSINTRYVGVEDNSIFYTPVYDLKTNKKDSTHDDLINFVKILNNDKSDSSSFSKTISTLLDPTYMSIYNAYCWAVGDPDDLRCNYNNAYLYFDSVNHRAYFIPYDHDRSLGVSKDGRGLMPSRRLTTTKCTGYSGDSYQTNPLFYRTCIIADKNDNNSLNLSSSYPICSNLKEELKKQFLLLRENDIFKPESFNNYIKENPIAKELGVSAQSKNLNNSYQEYYENLLKMFLEDDAYLLA